MWDFKSRCEISKSRCEISECQFIYKYCTSTLAGSKCTLSDDAFNRAVNVRPPCLHTYIFLCFIRRKRPLSLLRDEAIVVAPLDIPNQAFDRLIPSTWKRAYRNPGWKDTSRVVSFSQPTRQTQLARLLHPNLSLMSDGHNETSMFLQRNPKHGSRDINGTVRYDHSVCLWETDALPHGNYKRQRRDLGNQITRTRSWRSISTIQMVTAISLPRKLKSVAFKRQPIGMPWQSSRLRTSKSFLE
jgi:hypothetical protein